MYEYMYISMCKLQWTGTTDAHLYLIPFIGHSVRAPYWHRILTRLRDDVLNLIREWRAGEALLTTHRRFDGFVGVVAARFLPVNQEDIDVHLNTAVSHLFFAFCFVGAAENQLMSKQTIGKNCTTENSM